VEFNPWLTAKSFLITIALDRGDDGAGQTWRGGRLARRRY
jgi:hypothetical protein